MCAWVTRVVGDSALGSDRSHLTSCLGSWTLAAWGSEADGPQDWREDTSGGGGVRLQGPAFSPSLWPPSVEQNSVHSGLERFLTSAHCWYGYRQDHCSSLLSRFSFFSREPWLTSDPMRLGTVPWQHVLIIFHILKITPNLEGKSQLYVLEIGQNNLLSFYLYKF